MTIPITPGPFSFLATAGEAVGDIGTALQAKKQRLDTEARARLSDILQLINAGAEPTPFLGAGGAAAEHLGLAPAGQGAALLQGPAERARLQLDLARAQTAQAQGAAKITGAKADTAVPTAAAELTTAQAGATQAQATAAAAQSDLGVRQRINELVTTQLKTPEEGFGLLAARAAAGTLPYYSVLIQARSANNSLERQQNADRFKLLFEPLSNTDAVWRERLRSWEQRKIVETLGREEDKEFIKQWELNNPQPSVQAIQQELLEAAATQRGLTPEQYNAELDKTVGLVREVEAAHFPAAKLQALQQRVNEVLAGKKTPQQAEEEITVFYRSRGSPQAPLDAQLDILQFRSMLQGAQSESTRTRRK